MYKLLFISGFPYDRDLREPKKKEVKGCASSKHGCCYDGNTKATGPNGEGCPCAVTEFGCCPDNISPAQGPQMSGCIMSCNTSAYGCCQDGETPAHGPEYEGCCLLNTFGCCPDNRKPAEGPQLQGCGCQFSLNGCCPDNYTVARGPNKEGCGCQHTQHGCCPDRHTEASGPNYQGCGCHTYQFGCCPDGSTAAKGPNQQGCHCSQSQFGCCGDGQTAAQGLDMAGCDCSASKFGCCPDGQTEAKGVKFAECDNVPESRQASCSLKSDRGPCRNFTATYFFDMDYGGCSRFWYGGCEGNGNRFANEQECKDICVHPSPKDACKLPKSKGPCEGQYLRWYYDTNRDQCSQFLYGGCLGNDNNFETRDACQIQCEPARSEDQCKLPMEQGSCAGNFSRWGFNADSGRCDQFIWGGCEGNGNRFGSEAACIQKCDPPDTLKAECTLPQENGNCTEKIPRWYFNQRENRCFPFYYSGCNGNENNYQNEADCAQRCPSAYEKELCVLPAETGTCADYTVKWFYDTVENRCRQFYYGGCGGNGNKFDSETACESRCAIRENVITTTTIIPAANNQFSQELCFLEAERGPCNNLEQRWAYNSQRGVCVPFEYGGCGGNRNNFPDQEYCRYYCQATKDICQLPMSTGPCDESQMKWFYNAATDSCSQFTYGGCEGNENRFETRNDCEARCRPAPQPTIPVVTQSTPTVEPLDPKCQAVSSPGPCEYQEVWYYEPSRHECLPFTNHPQGSECKLENVFKSQESCDRQCGAFKGLEACRYPVDPGPCTEHAIKYFFNETAGLCQTFTYGGCHGGPNRFSSVDECEDTCRHVKRPTSNDPCSQELDAGSCSGYSIQWFYDNQRSQCLQFVYTGCGGNDNRFASQEQCEGRCLSTPTQVTPAPQPQERVQGECSSPPSLSPCGENRTVYYYEEQSGECVLANIGGCRYANSYNSEEECLRNCGTFKKLDVCRYKLDPGPCQASILKYYYDVATGVCTQYAYGGCRGGPNRFSTLEECESVCTGTESNEISEDCNTEREDCARLQCEYGVQRTRTAFGCERCECVSVQSDCTRFTEDCAQLKCVYGTQRTVGPDQCERCSCKVHPCSGVSCPNGERCVLNAFRDPQTQEPRYEPQCRTMEKPGSCPVEDARPRSDCRLECNDDADCQGDSKCCSQGCAHLCLSPSATAAPRQISTSTYVPELPQAPQANSNTEPEVTSDESGKATLRCLFHGNPPPRITWQRRQITIDGTVGRYRLLSDGALEIVSLYRNDSGVYICIADNGLGIARQEIKLQVNDPVERAAQIAGEEGVVVVGELGRPLVLRCLAYGHPAPSVSWYRGHTGPMVPFLSHQYEARGLELLIRSLEPATLGEYECQAYNGFGKPSSWGVLVQAYSDEAGDYLVPREPVRVTPRLPVYRTEPPLPEPQVPQVYTVPVSVRLVAPGAVTVGTDFSLPCEVDGYPTPEVYWTKNGAELIATDRIQLTESRLTISRAQESDSGEYGCHANNEYTTGSASVRIDVQGGAYIPAECSDSKYFANCSMIVKGKHCDHQYYSRFCCKSCVLSGQLTYEKVQMYRNRSKRRIRFPILKQFEKKNKLTKNSNQK